MRWDLGIFQASTPFFFFPNTSWTKEKSGISRNLSGVISPRLCYRITLSDLIKENNIRKKSYLFCHSLPRNL
jgi:hypothetical protein